MTIKKYKFRLRSVQAIQMWEFSRTYDVIFHFVNKKHNVNIDTIEYIYEGYMDPEIFLILKIIIPEIQLV